MSLSSAAVEQELFAFLAALPASNNPYVALASYLKSLQTPDVPGSAVYQLYVLSGILGLTTILFIIPLLIRWRKGVFWVVRQQHATGLIRPHFSVSWVLVSLAWLILIQPTIVREVQYFRGERHEDFTYWTSLVWLPCTWCGLVAAWGLLASHAVQQQAHRPEAARRYSLLVNSFGLCMPIIYTTIIVPVGVLAGRHSQLQVRAYRELEEFLLAQGATWEGAPFSIAKVAPALPVLQALATETELYLKWIIIFIARLYLTSLRRSMRSIRSAFASADSNHLQLSTHPSHKKFERTYQSLFIIIAAITAISVLFSSNALVAAIEPTQLATSTRLRVVILLPLWSFALFGAPTACLLIWRAIDAAPSDARLASANDDENRLSSRGGGGVKRAQGGGPSCRRTTSLAPVAFSALRFGREPTAGSSRKLSASAGPATVSVTVDVLIDEERFEEGEHESEQRLL
ncbi:hypothetical protein JCM21900_005092 [Sporobolomyces salmonicolor]